MATALPIDQRLETAGQLVVRARIFYDLWWFFDGDETRPTNIGTMNQYSEFFRFAPHAYFVSFIVHMAALLETRRDTINFPRLVKEYQKKRLIADSATKEVEALLQQAEPIYKKLKILRDYVFAHRSASLEYNDAFRKADVTPNELRDLTEIALGIVNRILNARGMNDQSFNTRLLTDTKAMLKALPQDTVE